MSSVPLRAVCSGGPVPTLAQTADITSWAKRHPKTTRTATERAGGHGARGHTPCNRVWSGGWFANLGKSRHENATKYASARIGSACAAAISAISCTGASHCRTAHRAGAHRKRMCTPPRRAAANGRAAPANPFRSAERFRWADPSRPHPSALQKESKGGVERRCGGPRYVCFRLRAQRRQLPLLRISKRRRKPVGAISAVTALLAPPLLSACGGRRSGPPVAVRIAIVGTKHVPVAQQCSAAPGGDVARSHGPRGPSPLALCGRWHATGTRRCVESGSGSGPGAHADSNGLVLGDWRECGRRGRERLCG